MPAACEVLQLGLRLFWPACTAAVALTVLDAPVPAAFKAAVRLSAARGKTWGEQPAGGAALLAGLSVPHAWFWHFYAVGVAANSATLAAVLLGGAALIPAVLPIAALQTHLLRRLLESTCLARYPPGARMHLFAYLFGLAYYVLLSCSLLPCSVCALASALPSLHNSSAGAALGRMRDAAAAASPAALLGLAIVAAGQALQGASHVQLARLPSGEGGAGNAYVVPRGGLFDLVSCPHYFAEIVIYVGFAVLLKGRGAVLLVLAWVVLNLVLGARAMHAWYRRKFDGYPRSRKALVPFVW